MAFIGKKNKQKSGFRSEGSRQKTYDNREYPDSGNKKLNKVTCTSCGNSCHVPFKPSPGKPVYCNDCFRKSNSNFTDRKPSRFNRDSGSERHEYGAKNRSAPSDLDQINEKLDRILKLLEQ